jgi:transposase
MAEKLESRTDLVAALRDLPRQARAAVAGLTDAQLDTPYRAGGWTLRQVVHHLADAHANGFFRMRLILTEDHPTLKPYDQDAWAALPDARGGPVEDSLRLLEALHTRIVHLAEAVADEAWARTAHHPEVGEVTFGGLIATYAEHGAHHVAQIVQARG